jgi:hypothetical protein
VFATLSTKETRVRRGLLPVDLCINDSIYYPCYNECLTSLVENFSGLGCNVPGSPRPRFFGGEGSQENLVGRSTWPNPVINYFCGTDHHPSLEDYPAGLSGVLQKLNKAIGDRHYEVGITFFLREDLDEQIEDIWRMEIEPYLEEYFFDQPDKANQFRWDAIKGSLTF